MRAISTMMAALILIAIVAFAGAVLFAMTAGFFRGAGKASITLSATGTGSSDGGRATVNLVIQNTGDGAARVVRIYVAPESAGVSLNALKVTGFELEKSGKLGKDTLPPLPKTSPTTGEIVDAKASRTVFLYITGSGLYAGAQLRIFVVYYDMGSGEPGIADTVVILR